MDLDVDLGRIPGRPVGGRESGQCSGVAGRRKARHPRAVFRPETVRATPLAISPRSRRPPARSDGIPGRLGVVAPPGRGRPPEGAVGELLDLPPGLLLEPVIMATLRARVTQTRPAARRIRRVVLEIAAGGGPAAHRAGARRVPDLGQMPQPDPGVMPPGLETMLARVGADGVEGDDQVRAGPGGAQPPGAVPSGRSIPAGAGEGEPRPGGARPSRVLRPAASGRAQPCPMAWPCWSVTVTHHVVAGFLAAARPGREPATGRRARYRGSRRAGRPGPARW